METRLIQVLHTGSEVPRQSVGQLSQDTGVDHADARALPPVPDLSAAACARIIDHPRFEEAARLAAEAIVQSYRGNWAINRMLNDRGRMLAAMMVLDLSFATEDNPGFTVAALRAEAGRYGFASPRRVAAWVASLRLLGFLTVAKPGRPQRLTPTERFLALHQIRIRRIWDALSLLHPDSSRAAALLSDPAFLGRFAQALMTPYRRGVRLLSGVPDLVPIADRDAGLTVLLSLFLADVTGRPVSMAELARTFKVSRAHVLSILREAEAQGLVVRDDPQKPYRMSPVLSVLIRRFLAALFLTHIYVIDTALGR